MARDTTFIGREDGRTSWVWSHRPWEGVFAVIVGPAATGIIHHHPEILDQVRMDAVTMEEPTPDLIALLAKAGEL